MVYLPLWKIFISQMGVLFPKYGKIKMFQTTNQYLLDTFGVLCCVSPTRQHAESFNYVLFFLRCGVGVTGFQLRRVVPESSSKAIQKHPLLPASTPRLSGTPRQSTKKSEVKKTWHHMMNHRKKVMPSLHEAWFWNNDGHLIQNHYKDL